VEIEMTTAAEAAVLTKKLEQYEGNIEHMYLDGEGNVTIGVGHLIPDASHAAGLTLYMRKTGVPATDDQKKSEYESVVKEQRKPAAWYRSKTTLFIKPADVEALTNEHLRSFENELKNLYNGTAFPPGFDKLPEPVRLALFDMIFNLGATRLKREFPKLNRAIANGDWNAAASECNRPQVQVARNNYVKGLFQAAADAQKASAPAAPSKGTTNVP